MAPCATKCCTGGKLRTAVWTHFIPGQLHPLLVPQNSTSHSLYTRVKALQTFYADVIVKLHLTEGIATLQCILQVMSKI